MIIHILLYFVFQDLSFTEGQYIAVQTHVKMGEST